jgi:maltooligosyltrehalose trehalohydrolase
MARGPFRTVVNFSDAPARVPLDVPCEVVLARPGCKLLPGPCVQLPARGAAVLRTREATVEG